MQGSVFLQVLPAVVLYTCSYFSCSASAQFPLGHSAVLDLEDYDSDEIIPVVRQVRVPEPNNYLQPQSSATNVKRLSSPATIPLTDDVLKQLRSLLIVAPENKITKLKLPRKRASKSTVLYTPAVTTPIVPTTTSMSSTSTVPTTPAMSTMSTVSNPARESVPDSREVGKKWFPMLLQEAIDNILQKNTSDMDELDELVDQIASGSRAHRHQTYEAPPASYRSLYTRQGTTAAEASELNLSSVNLDHFNAGIPYVVNIFNNTKIGYIVMKVANDSEIRVEQDGLEEALQNGTEKRAVPSVVQEHKDIMLPSPNSMPQKMVMPIPGYNELPKVQYFHKTTPTVPQPARPPAVEPPYFNILNTADNEPVKYRVLLRNNDAPPEKINVRVPLPGQLVNSPAQLYTGDRRPSPSGGRQSTGKRKPTHQEQPQILRGRHHPDDTMVESIDGSRPARRMHGPGHVLRKYDYESLEDEREESTFTNTETNTVTQRTAKILSSGKHSPTGKRDSHEKHRRTMPEPYSEAPKYNFGRTFGTTASGAGSREQRTTRASISSADISSIDDLPGDDVLFNQAPENRMVRAGHDSTVEAYRRKRTEDDTWNRPLKRSVPTSDGALNELFEHGTGKGRGDSESGGHRWDSLKSSEELNDSYSA